MEDLIRHSDLKGAALLIFDDLMTVSSANPQTIEVLHASPETLFGHPLHEIDALFRDLTGAPIPEEERPLYQTIAKGERLWARGFILERKDGTLECIHLSTQPLFHEDGTVSGLVASMARCCRDQERLAQFLGAMDEIAFEFDAEGHYLNVWSGNEDLLRVPRHQLFGRRFDEFIPREMADRLFQAFQRIRQSEKPETFEYALEVQGGKRWFLARIALVPPAEGGGEPTFSFQARDITGQKLLEHSLRESERRFRGLFEHAGAGIALVGLDGRCLEVNPCLRDMLGYSEEELRRKPFSDYSHPEDVSADLKQFTRMACGEIDSYRMEKRFFRKEGQIVWGHLTVALQRDGNGSPLYVIAILENITDRKRIEAEKEHLIGELEAIFASAGDGILFYDAEGNILRLNAAAKEILGYSDALISSSLAERYQRWAPRLPDGTLPPLEESPLFQVFQGKAARRTVTEIRGPDEQRIWVSFSASPVFDASGRQIGAVATVTDITRVRELQERLEDYIHMLAHDLRSPLTVISGHAEVLREILRLTSFEKEGEESTEAILGASEQMLSIMEDLVEVGRLESDQVTLHHDEIKPPEFVRGFLDSHISADYRRIVSQIPSDLPSVRIGRNHLGRILENLIGNALKYSDPDQEVKIDASCEGGQVCISIADSGQGIAPEELPRVFDRFYRAANARSKTGGTGMGLFITKRLLESYGGTIRAQSTLGQGSTFTFCLPEATC